MTQLAPGSLIAGYRIDGVVGRGGMGVVYRAVQLGLDRVVALKVIAPELVDDDAVRERFLAEARAAAGVDHPNVIPVHEAGEDGGVAFIAMRFVAGSDLRSLVRARGALDVAEAVRVVAQAGAALDAIHRAGFVHRDVKPANLLVNPDGHVYLTDFGLVKEILSHSGATRTGHWVGTLDYVAPEQIRGGSVDARTDVYALGGVLHFALTGRVPFERHGEEAKLWAQLSAPPPVPSELRPELPAAFDAVIARAMAKAADERFPSAGDLALASLAAASGTLPTEPERIVARGAAAPLVPGLEYSTRTAAGPVPPRSRSGRVRAAIAIGVLAGAGAAGWLILRSDDPPATAQVTPTPTRTATVAPAFTMRTIEDVGDRPNGLALAAGDVWVTSANSEWLTLVSAATGTERTDHPKIGRDIRAIVADGDSVWLARASTHEIVRMDADSRRIVAAFGVPATPTHLAVDRRGIWVGVTREDDAVLLRYDRAGKLRGSLTVREGIGGLVAGAGTIWVIKRSTNKLAQLARGGDRLVDWASLSGEAGSLRYADGALWATLPSEDAVARVEAKTGRTVIGSAGRAPADSVVADGRLLVSSRNDNTVVVLEPDTLRVADTPIEVPLNPFSLVGDGRSVWVTGLADNTLTRIGYG